MPRPALLIRRNVLAGLAALLFAGPAAAQQPGLRAALRHHLPPGLDPAALGAALRAAHPACSTQDCLARAALADPAALPAQSAADFAEGHTVIVDGWVLSRTEAWLCAALA